MFDFAPAANWFNRLINPGGSRRPPAPSALVSTFMLLKRIVKFP
jgi:hypothetical protein